MKIKILFILFILSSVTHLNAQLFGGINAPYMASLGTKDQSTNGGCPTCGSGILLAWWKMWDDGGNVAHDYSGNGFTLYGIDNITNAYWTNGIGINSSLYVANSAEIIQSTGGVMRGISPKPRGSFSKGGWSAASIMGWMYHTNTNCSTGFGFGDAGYSNNNNFTFVCVWDKTNVYVAQTTVPLTPNYFGEVYTNVGWHHFDVNFDGTKSPNSNRISFYIDGIVQTNFTNGPNPTQFAGALGYTIGVPNGFYSMPPYNITVPTYAPGGYEDLRVYGTNLTSNQIAGINGWGATNDAPVPPDTNGPGGGPSSGLQAWWKMWDNAGNTPIDSSGSGVGNMSWSGSLVNPTWATGMSLHSALSMRGINALSRNVNNIPNINNGTTHVSITGWMNVTSGQGGSFGSYIAGSGTVSLFVSDNSSSSIVSCTTNANTPQIGTFTASTGWHHFAVVYDGTKSAGNRCILYIDGSSQGLGGTPSFPSFFSGPIGVFNFDLGRYDAGDGNGTQTLGLCLYEDIRVYSVSLAPSQISSIYNWGLSNN